MNDKKTAVLLIGFGGPTRPEEVKPFLDTILGGSNIPEARWKEVLHHYDVVGGRSPFNELTLQQKEALEKYLKAQGKSLPIGVAFRHSHPTFTDAFESFQKHGVERVVALVLASFRSFVSLQWYIDKAQEGRLAAKADKISVTYTEPFETDPLYLEAQTERVREIRDRWTAKEKSSTTIIYTAHSIPQSMCEQSSQENQGPCYGYQFAQAAKAISGLLGLSSGQWTTCYQSRTGNPRDAWLVPDVRDVVRGVDKKRFTRVLLVPVGFLCDNVEIIYDLDVDAKAVCQTQGLEYHRARPVSDHPKFIEMMGRRILEKV